MLSTSGSLHEAETVVLDSCGDLTCETMHGSSGMLQVQHARPQAAHESGGTSATKHGVSASSAVGSAAPEPMRCRKGRRHLATAGPYTALQHALYAL